MSLKVGITGGIGVGKSFCAKIFTNFGIPLYDADSRAKWLMTHDENVKKDIIKNFGDESYSEDGSLNRTHLSNIIFQEKGKAQIINQIVHPAVGMDLFQWFEKVDTHYGLYEAALMYESGSVGMLDKVIVVDAPLELRIDRTKNRDNISRDDVLARIQKQKPQEEKVSKADYVIENDGVAPLLKQIWEIHSGLLTLESK